MLLFVYVTTMCDSLPIDIEVKQSVNNITSDTIVIINSRKEFHGIDIDTIICYPSSEKIFYNNIHKKQPLEPYDIPLIYKGSCIITSSGRQLIKDIFDKKKWDFDKQKKSEWLSFTIREADLQ